MVLLVAVSSVYAAQDYYLENLTYAQPFDNVTSSYVFQNTTPQSNGNYYQESATLQHVETSNFLPHYTFSGNGRYGELADPRCFYDGVCMFLSGTAGGGATPEITNAEHNDTYDMSGNTDAELLFNFLDWGLDTDEGMEILFFNGFSFDVVYEYNGSGLGTPNNNTYVEGDFMNLTIPITAPYQVANFKWLIRSSMPAPIEANAGIIFNKIELNVNDDVVYTSPTFYHLLTQKEQFLAMNSTLYAETSNAGEVNVTIQHYSDTGALLKTYKNTSAVSPGNNTLYYTFETNPVTDIGNENDYFVYYAQTVQPSDSYTRFYWGNATPSYVGLDFIVGDITVEDLRVDLETDPLEVFVNVTSFNPIDNVSLYRDGEFLGLMGLVSGNVYGFIDTAYDFSYTPLDYEVVVFDTIGFSESANATIDINVSETLVILANFEGEFFVGLNDLFLFEVTVLDTASNIRPDVDLALNFTTLGQSFPLTYNYATQWYETTLNFSELGDYPFEVVPTTLFYVMQGNTEGLVHVREDFQMCFSLYTDRNGTDPYNNDLMWLFAVEEQDADYVAMSATMTLWSEGATRMFTKNTLHTPYRDGQGCFNFYNATPQYHIFALDGVFTFTDNYDVPNVISYGGTYLDLGVYNSTPGNQYNIYIPRYDLTWKRLFLDFRGFLIFTVIVILAFISFIATMNPLAPLATFITLAGLWGVIEVLIWLLV